MDNKLEITEYLQESHIGDIRMALLDQDVISKVQINLDFL